MKKVIDPKYACNARVINKVTDEETVCGEQADLMLQYETAWWPMSFGRVVLCMVHSKKMWDLLCRTVDLY